MFPSSTHSSGDLYGGELRCVVWWRFGQAKDGTARTLSAPAICVAVVKEALVFFLRSLLGVRLERLRVHVAGVYWLP